MCLHHVHAYPPVRRPEPGPNDPTQLLAEAEASAAPPTARPGRLRALGAAAAALVAILAVVALTAATGPAVASPPRENVVAEWNRIAEDAVVASGAFQNEGLVYMAYVSAAVYDAVVAVEGGYEPYGAPLAAPAGASAEAAAVEAAYRTLVHSFPSQQAKLDAFRADSLARIADGDARRAGEAVGAAAAAAILDLRRGDGRMTPIGLTSPFPTLPWGAGVWRLTPSAFAAPQTPWVAGVRPFVLRRADQFLPEPPPALSSQAWTEAFDEVRAFGAATGAVRTEEQTAIARFWSANVIRRYNRVARDLAIARNLGPLETARLAAMVNVVGADAQIAVMHAKYHYLFWRPVTAIDPGSVTFDGFGHVPGYDDGNGATAEQPSWRPLLATPNHPEYPAARGSITSAMAEVFGDFLGTNRIDVDVRGFDPGGSPGNLDAVRRFAMPNELRNEIVGARVWAGVHYRFSGVAGVALGRNVAKYDLRHAFRPVAG